MRVLITGANGFLGSHLVDRLLTSPAIKIRVLVRKTSDLRWIEGKPIEQIFGDVTQPPPELAAALKGIDTVFHLAGVTKALRRRSFYAVNEQGTGNMLEACLRGDTKPSRLVLVSSAGALGPSTSGQPLCEDVEPRPVDEYGRSKLAAEEICRRYRDRLSIAVVRPAAIYGPRDFELLAVFQAVRHGLAARLGLGESRLNLCHAQDVAQAIWLAGTVSAAGSEAFMIGGANTTQSELIRTIASVLGKKRLVPLAIPGPLVRLAALASSTVGLITRRPRIFTHGNAGRILAKNWTLDISKAQRLLGYRPEFDLQRGIEDTVAWYRAQNLL